MDIVECVTRRLLLCGVSETSGAVVAMVIFGMLIR